MNLPKQISPNPLIISTIELRFVSDLDDNNLLQTFFPLFSETMPKLTPNKIPKDLRNSQEQFKFAADYTFSNDTYSVSISNKSISFENVSEYTLWDNYFSFIKNQLSKIFNINIIKKIDRVGVRYGSILPNDIGSILKKEPSFSVENFIGNFTQFRTDFKKDDINLHLFLAKNIKVERNGTIKFGTLIDIDASTSNNLLADISIFRIIENLHSEEKSFFFNLLHSDYITKLNPQY